MCTVRLGKNGVHSSEPEVDFSVESAYDRASALCRCGLVVTFSCVGLVVWASRPTMGFAFFPPTAHHDCFLGVFNV